jgi:outer membrane receptor for ferrienterochelin and colicin
VVALAAPILLAAGSAAAADPPAAAPADKPASDSPAAKTVEGVTVNGAQQAYRSSIDRKSYSITGDLQATTGAIADALRNVPSIEVDVQGNITLRGQPVTIMVDGKPSGLFRGDAGAQALQSMSADQYERVEVITNPSAEFRPDGTGGIINLISKKNRKPGYSASVKANYGSEGRYNGSVTGGYNSNKLTLSGTAGVRRDPQKFKFTRTRETPDPAGGTADSRDEMLSVGDGRFYNANLSADYDLDDKNRLSAELGYFGMRIRNQSFDHYEGENGAGDLVSAYDQVGLYNLNVDVWNGKATWTRKFSDDGHALTVSLSQEHVLQHQRTPDVLSVHLPPAADVYENAVDRTASDETDLKVDYTRPLPHEAKLKAGYELDLQENDLHQLRRSRPVDRRRGRRSVADQHLHLQADGQRRLRQLRAAVRRPHGAGRPAAGDGERRHQPGDLGHQGVERLHPRLSEPAPGLQVRRREHPDGELQPARPAAVPVRPEPVPGLSGPLQLPAGQPLP